MGHGVKGWTECRNKNRLLSRMKTGDKQSYIRQKKSSPQRFNGVASSGRGFILRFRQNQTCYCTFIVLSQIHVIPQNMKKTKNKKKLMTQHDNRK